MNDLLLPTYLELPAAPTNPALRPLWDNLTQTFAVAMCPNKFLRHTTRIKAFLDSIDSTHTPDFTLFADSVTALYRTQGRTRIEEVALASGVSRRHLERRFKRATGLSPKRLARLIRFEAVREQLLHDPLYRLTDLPYEFGYTDQAHFINDFKGLAALTPGEFVGLVLNGNALEDDDYCIISRNCEQSQEGTKHD